MNQTKIKRATQFAILIAAPLLLMAYSDQPPAGYAGAPGENGTCTGCHRVTAGTGNVQVKFPGALSYTPGVKQSLQVVLTDAGKSRWGFEVTARLTGNTQAGTFTSTDSNTVISCADDNVRPNTGCPTSAPTEFIETRSAGTQRGTPGPAVFNFDWTPPATSMGNVVFYVVGLAANNDGNTSGDTTYTTTATLTPGSSAPPVTLTTTPAALSFGYQIGGPLAAAQTVALGSSGAAIAFTSSVSTTAGGSWLTAAAATGTTPASLSVSVNPTGLVQGTYTGSVTIAAPTATNTPQTIPVTFTVTAPVVLPTLSLSPAALTFSAQSGGVAPASQAVSVASTGAVLSYTAAASATWLKVTPISGISPSSLSISVNQAGLAAGTYTGSVAVAASGAVNTPQSIAVTFTVAPAPSLTVSPATLSFAFQTGGAAPAAKTISVGGTGLNYAVAASGGTWLAATPVSGTAPGSVSVSVNPAGLAAGTYNGTVAITAASAANSPQNVAVTLIVSAAPTITVSPASLSFSFQTGGAALAAQTISVAGTGLNYTVAASGGTWLAATPVSGTTPGSVSVSVNPAGLAAGTYNGTVAITAAGAANSPQSVAVTLTVSAAPTMTVSPATLSFSFQTGGAAPAAKTISVGGTSLNYTVAASGGTWLAATPVSGTTPGSVSVSVNPAALAAGTYSGMVVITAAGAGNSPQTVAVSLIVTTASTLTISPTTLSFSYLSGSAVPAAKAISVAGTGLSYTVASSGGSWLAATPASGSTPGSVIVSVNPAGMGAGTYNGTVTITATATGSSPQTVAVTLTVTAATLSLQVSPATLSFAYATGGAAPAAQSISVASSASALSFSAAVTGGSWLSATPTVGSTPRAIAVAVNAAGMAAGTYQGSIAIAAGGAANSPQTVAVTLVVTGPTSTSLLRLSTHRISFGGGDDGEERSASSQSVRVTSSGTPLAFTASPSGGNWLSITQAGGTTPAVLSVSANRAGLASGNYSAVVTVTAGAQSASIAVTLSVGSSEDGGSNSRAIPVVTGDTASGLGAAQWVGGAGVPASGSAVSVVNSGLMLFKAPGTVPGAIISRADGLVVSELGFDLHGDGSSGSPRFKIVTGDGVEHLVGINPASLQPSPAEGWTHWRFDPSDPAQATPQITPGQRVKSISLVLDGDGTGPVVVDNISINGRPVNKQ
jgi:hypothetical protein